MKSYVQQVTDHEHAATPSSPLIHPTSVIVAGAEIGSGSRIGAAVFLGGDIILGSKVDVGGGSYIDGRTRIDDGVHIGPHVTFIGDGSDSPSEAVGKETRVHRDAKVRGGATILPGITIGRGACIDPGAVVDRDVPPYAIVRGNPACITGYSDAVMRGTTTPAAKSYEIGRTIEHVDVLSFTTATDLRGDLMAVNLERQVPFTVKRFFFVTNVPSHHVRGEHGHKECHQLLVCLQGSVSVSADNGRQRGQWVLDHPGIGLHIHPMVWAAQYQYSPNAVLAVFASHPYDPDDYIRDYEDFLKLVNARGKSHE